MKVKIYKDNKRFTGEFSDLGEMSTTEEFEVLNVDSLPPTKNANEQKFYRLSVREVQTGTQQIPVMVQAKDEDGNLLWEDSESKIPKMIQDTDEEGNPLFTEEPIIESITEWIFDEEDYNKWKEEQEALVPEPTNEEKIKKLSNENEMLSETLDYVLTVMMPSGIDGINS